MTIFERIRSRAKDKGMFAYMPVVGTICIGLAVSIAILVVSSKYEHGRLAAQLEKDSQGQVSMIRRQAELHMLELESTAAFFGGSVSVERAEFSEFVNIFLRVHRDVHAIAWVPRVTESQRSIYVEKAQSEGLANFEITRRTETGGFVKAGGQAEYFPVYYIDPMITNSELLGFDLSSVATFAETMKDSRISGLQVSTPRLKLIEDDASVILILQPVYYQGLNIESEQGRIDALQGFVVGLFHVGELLEEALQGLKAKGIGLYVFDLSAPEGERFLYGYGFDGSQSVVPQSVAEAEKARTLYYSDSFDFAGRRWQVVCLGTEAYVKANRSYLPWWEFLSGLLVTGFLAGYFLKRAQRIKYIESIVSKRTAELESEISQRKHIELALRMSEQCFRAIADYTYYWELWISPEGNILWTNPAVLRVTGYDIKEFMAIKDFPKSIVAQEDRDRIARAFKSALGGSSGREMEFHLIRKDGSKIWAEISWQPIYDDNGASQGHRASIRDISDRKKAQRELKESQQMLRSVLDTIPARVFWKDSNSIYLGCNREFAKDAGLDDPDQIVGKDDFQLVWKDQAQLYRSDDRLVFETGVPKLNYEEPQVRPSGELRWLRTSKIPLIDLSGEAIGILGTYEDISVSKRAQEELARSEERYALAQRAANIGSWDLNIATGELAWSEQIEPMFGFSPGEFGGSYDEFMDRVHPKDRKYIKEAVQASVDQGQDYSIEHRIVWPDGTIRWVSETGSVIRDENGQPVRMLGIVEDITARKKAEQALAESEEQNRLTLENMASGFALHEMIYDKQGRPTDYRYLRVNPAYEKLVGVKNPSGKRVKELYPGLEQYWIDTYGEITRTGIARRFESYQSEIDMWWDVVGFRVKPGQFACIFNDITDRKKSEKEREILLKKLDTKAKELESILYVASHDLRSPLVNIQGFSYELSRCCKLIGSSLGDKGESLMGPKAYSALKEGIPEAIGFISTSAEKMDLLLAGLLRISRLGKEGIKIETLDMDLMLSRIAGSMEYQIQEAKAEVRIDPLPQCMGDESQINQVFSNLLDNALKYLDKSRRGVIHIYGRTEDEQSVYCVEDNGVGIALDHQEKIFETFHRLEPEQSKGEGLGLTIVKRIIDIHGGRVWLDSEPGKGSKFYISLPRRMFTVT